MKIRFLELFAPDPPASVFLKDPEEIDKSYRYWRIRQMYSTFIGYAVYYFVRQNMSIAMPLMEKALGITKTSLGAFLSLHKILYGVSKFLNGMLGDRANPRYFMVVGLFLSALMNILFGFSSAVVTLGVFWMINGWFQGMGFPPCARVLSHWFSPKERGTTWSIWNSSHQVGALSILILAGYLAKQEVNFTLHIPFLTASGQPFSLHLGSWQLCFIVPALIAIAVSFFLLNRLRDTPGSLGLPPVEVYREEEGTKAEDAGKTLDGEAFRKFLRRYVFGNRYIWYICFANFFIYILRYAFLDWAPSCLYQMKGVALHHAGWMTAGFELFGAVGSIVAGYITDRYLNGRRAPVCVIFMLSTIGLIYLYWKAPAGNNWYITLLLVMLGFFIYGPQFLVGVMTADQATKHAAATAIGLTGFFGYLSGIISGWGLGWTVQHYGWDASFVFLMICAVFAAFFFTLVWNARPVKEDFSAMFS